MMAIRSVMITSMHRRLDYDPFDPSLRMKDFIDASRSLGVERKVRAVLDRVLAGVTVNSGLSAAYASGAYIAIIMDDHGGQWQFHYLIDPRGDTEVIVPTAIRRYEDGMYVR